MSDKKRYPYQDAIAVAGELLSLLEQHCHRIVIAGSLRRRKADVGDIELVYLPRMGERAVDLLAKESYSIADAAIDNMTRSGFITKRPNINGVFTWGAKNKLAVHAASGIPVDFFAVPEEKNWWVSLVVRTGGKETNLKLTTTGAQRLGRSLNAYGCGVTCSDYSIIPATSEEDVFRLCGVPYQDPEKRT